MAVLLAALALLSRGVRAQTPEQPLAEPLVDVRIEGNGTILTEAVARHIKTRPGRPPAEKQIRDDVKQLYATRWFLSVEPRYRRTDEGLVLIFKVIERPIVQRVEYVGNKAIKTKKLAVETGLKEGSAFDVSINREAARRLEEYYRDEGYAFATVTLERGGSQQDREVVFRINEGPKVVVTKVKFVGNDDISDGVLDLKLNTKKAILTVLGGKYDPATIPNDILALKEYYHGLGYFDVRIEESRSFHQPLIPIPFLKDRSHAHIEYVIDEGVRYTVENVEVAGHQIFTTEQLKEGMELKPGEPFNARFLNADVDRIKDKYGELGRLFARVEATPRFREDRPGVADIIYRIDEDRPYRFRRIDVELAGDHPHTKRTVVYNIVQRDGVRPGHLASASAIRRARIRLAGSEYFDRVGP
ncbi:MAG: hypothetical protein KY476_18125, partial [Planctomycetes bacterium]|nr:hypothetical protein [Planctomycetota bacterium]